MVVVFSYSTEKMCLITEKLWVAMGLKVCHPVLGNKTFVGFYWLDSLIVLFATVGQTVAFFFFIESYKSFRRALL